jgi:carbonic anhydrase
MEYSCKVAGSKLILVMGHESCGAVKAAIDEVELGNITGLLSKIEPAIEKSEDFEGDHSTKNAKYVDHVITNNVLLTMDQIRDESPILKEMEEKGEIKIVGAYYSLQSGEVTFL